MSFDNMLLHKNLLGVLFLLALILQVKGDSVEVKQELNLTETVQAIVEEGVQQLAAPFLRNFCKFNVDKKENDQKTKCQQWFDDALDHCDSLLRIGKFQPPKIFDPDTADELDFNMSIATIVDTLSTIDCKYLLTQLAQDFIRLEPMLMERLKKMKLLLGSIGLVIIGMVSIWWFKNKRPRESAMITVR